MKMDLLPESPAFPLGPGTRVAAAWDFELSPGESVSPHTHSGEEEIYCVLEGRGRMTVADVPHTVAAGEIVHIPPDSRHSISNPFDSPMRAVAVEVRAG